MSATARTLIGKSSSLLGREAVWQVPDGIEIQSKERYEIVRRRVLYEDILFVTHHRRYGTAYLISTGLIAFFFIAIGLAIVAASFDAWPAAAVFAAFGLPSLIFFVLRLMFRLDVITVYGKRTKASIRFGLRKQRARNVYTQVTTAVRIAQERMRRQVAEEEKVPTEEISNLTPFSQPRSEESSRDDEDNPGNEHDQ